MVVQSLLSDNQVVVFSKSRCPFCFEVYAVPACDSAKVSKCARQPYCSQAIRVLQLYAVPFHLCQLDQEPNGAGLHSVLKKQHKHHTVPCIFIDGQVYKSSTSTSIGQLMLAIEQLTRADHIPPLCLCHIQSVVLVCTPVLYVQGCSTTTWSKHLTCNAISSLLHAYDCWC